MRAKLQAHEIYAERYTGNIAGAIGTDYYLDPAYGSDGDSGLTPTTAFKSLAVGYAALESGKNDVLHLIGDGTSLTLPAAATRLFDWAKSYTHFVGECAPVGVGNRARIFAAAASVAPTMFRVSGSGCIFRNLSFFYGVASALALYSVEVTGGRNYFENVRIAGIGDDTQDVQYASSLYLNAGSENTFRECDIGLTTIGRGTGVNTEIYIAGAALRNSFKKSRVWCRADTNTHTFVEKTGTAGLDWLMFEECKFLNISTNNAVSLLSAITMPAGTNTSLVILDKPSMFGCADWEVNNRGNVIVFASPAATAATDGRGFSIA